jgi:hypothetical protein
MAKSRQRPEVVGWGRSTTRPAIDNCLSGVRLPAFISEVSFAKTQRAGSREGSGLFCVNITSRIMIKFGTKKPHLEAAAASYRPCAGPADALTTHEILLGHCRRFGHELSQRGDYDVGFTMNIFCVFFFSDVVTCQLIRGVSRMSLFASTVYDKDGTNAITHSITEACRAVKQTQRD